MVAEGDLIYDLKLIIFKKVKAKKETVELTLSLEEVKNDKLSQKVFKLLKFYEKNFDKKVWIVTQMLGIKDIKFYFFFF